ncbi:t-SNARE [Obelidium mucronatum]|nr:t-SNARE [Obelidium mucronatum]
MTLKDRTSEFHACADSLSQRNNVTASARLLSQTAVPNKSEEINATMAKLHSLTRLAKKKTLFDDRPNEINDLVLGIKQDITSVNRHISLLQQHQRNMAQSLNSSGPPQASKQIQEHSSNVITSLQTKLASTSNEFKSILELRTQNMKDQKNRRDQYSFNQASSSPAAATASASGYNIQGSQQHQQPLFGIPQSSASPLFAGESTSSSLFNPGSTTNYSSPLYNPERKLQNNSFDGALEDGIRNRGSAASEHHRGDSVIDMGGSSMQQQQLVQGNNAATMEYIESRGQAIESIESTIAELGQIYSQFTQILSQQREMVQRIDVNVMDTEVNVTNAHNELAKFLERLQGNRWLMIQVFGILVVFFMLFVVIS